MTRRWIKRGTVVSVQCAVLPLGRLPKRRLSKTSDRFPRLTEPLNHCPLTSGLGIPEDKIFTGYDAVDNAYFAARADEVRAAAK